MPRKERLEGSANSLDLTGLADEWDGVPVIRDGLRDGARLLPEAVECTVKTCGENAPVLSPILLRMAGTPEKKFLMLVLSKFNLQTFTPETNRKKQRKMSK